MTKAADRRPAVQATPAPSTNRVRGPLAVVIAVVAALLLGACQPAPTSLITDYKAATTAALTPDGTDAYDLRSTSPAPLDGRSITARKTNTSTNLRIVGFAKSSPSSTDQQSCVTFRSGATGNSQPGVALRIAASADRVRAITVTQNILYGARWVFNVHLGDSKGNSMTRVGGLTVAWRDAPLPWVICGRAQGRTVTVKVWPAAEAEPAWDDPAHSAAVTVPPSWVYAGRPGFYAGHLAAGSVLDYSATSASAITATPSPDGALVATAPAEPQELRFH